MTTFPESSIGHPKQHLPVELGHNFGQMLLQLIAGPGRDCREAEGGALARVPGGIVVGQVHELVDEVGLAHVGGQTAELLVGGEVAPGHRVLAQLALLEHLGVLVHLHELSPIEEVCII